MMYAKYAFAVVMAAVAVRAEDEDAVLKKNCCDSVASGTSCAHSSSFRKCGVPSSCCFESSCCPSDKKAFEERYTGENAVEFVRFYPEELVIDGRAATSTDFEQVAGKTPEDPKVDFAFLKRTGAFVVSKNTPSATREGEETAGQQLPEGAIITGWQSKTGSYLLDAPKEDATTLDFDAKKAKTVIGFWVKSSSMKTAAAVGKSHSEVEDANAATNTDDATDKVDATNTDPKETENKEGEEPKSNNTLWFIIAGVVAVVIVVGIIAYFVLAGGDDAEEEEEETDEEAAEEA